MHAVRRYHRCLPPLSVSSPAYVAMLRPLALISFALLSSCARASHGDGDSTVGQKPGGTWSALPPLPGARVGPATAAIGSTLYVVGGSASAAAFAYETAASTWVTLPPCPYQRSYGGAGASATDVFVAGAARQSELATALWLLCVVNREVDAWSLCVVNREVDAPSTAIRVLNCDLHLAVRRRRERWRRRDKC